MVKLLSIASLVINCLCCLNAIADQTTIAGVVKNPDGSVAKQATVTLYDLFSSTGDARIATTGDDGRFELANVPNGLSRIGLRATSRDGTLCAMIERGSIVADKERVEANITLEESWTCYFDVVDKADRPIADAVVVVQLRRSEFFDSKSDASGRAQFRLPRSQPIIATAAWKDQAGFQYHSYLPTVGRGSAPNKEPLCYPAETADKLVLSGARSSAVQVVDDQGNAIRNVLVYPSYFSSSREPGLFQPPAGIGGQRTDDGGMVVFHWIPSNYVFLEWQATAEPEFLRSIHRTKLDDESIVITLERPVKIRGRVIDPEGHGKAGIRVVAQGATFERSFDETASTDQAGKFELSVAPNAVYIVGVEDKQWVAVARDGIVMQRGADVELDDIQLLIPTRLSGRMLDVFTRNPITGEEVGLARPGRKLSTEELARLDNPKNVKRELIPQLYQKTETDADGRYEFLVAPGEYNIQYMGQSRPQKIIGQEAVSHDLPARAKQLEEFSGVVVDKSTGAPLAKASVSEAVGVSTWRAETDKQGKFSVQRALAGTLLVATSDHAGAGTAYVPPGSKSVQIECLPTCTVRGKLESVDGKPLAKAKFMYQTVVRPSIVGKPFALTMNFETNAQGEFVIKGLFAGQTYILCKQGQAGKLDEITQFKAEAGAEFDLGTLTP